MAIACPVCGGTGSVSLYTATTQPTRVKLAGIEENYITILTTDTVAGHLLDPDDRDRLEASGDLTAS